MTSLCGIFYADDAGVVSQLPEKLRNIMAVIEIMCLRTKGVPEASTILSVEAAGQAYNQTNDFVYLRGNANHNADLSNVFDRCAYATHGIASGSTPLNCTTGRALSSSSNSGMPNEVFDRITYG